MSKLGVHKAKVAWSASYLTCQLPYIKIVFCRSEGLTDVSISLCSHLSLTNFSESLCECCQGVIYKSDEIAVLRLSPIVTVVDVFLFFLQLWYSLTPSL